MQILDGTLTIEVIPGRRGDFCVGTLLTSIGEFKVKDAALDQFERGSYIGRFTVEKIYMESAKWRNGWFANLMAKIALEKEASGDNFYKAKLATARFYFARLQPETATLIRQARSGSANLMALDADLF